MGGVKDPKYGPGDADSDSGTSSLSLPSEKSGPGRPINSGQSRQSGNSEVGKGISNKSSSSQNKSDILGPMSRSASIATSGSSKKSVKTSSTMGLLSKSNSISISSRSRDAKLANMNNNNPFKVEKSAAAAASHLRRGSPSVSRSRSRSRSVLRSLLEIPADAADDDGREMSKGTTVSGRNGQCRARSQQKRPSSSRDNSKFVSSDDDGSTDGWQQKIPENDSQTSSRASLSSSGLHIDERVREKLRSQGLSTEKSRLPVLPCLSGSNSNHRSRGGSSVASTNSGTDTGSSSKSHWSYENQPLPNPQESQRSRGGSEMELLQRCKMELNLLTTYVNEHDDAIYGLRGRQDEHEKHLQHLHTRNNETNERHMENDGIIQNLRQQINLINQIQRNGGLQKEGLQCPKCGNVYASRPYMRKHIGTDVCLKAQGFEIPRGSRVTRGGGGGDGNGGDAMGLGH